MKIHEVVRIKLGKTDSSAADAFVDDFKKATDSHPLDHSARLLSNVSITIGVHRGRVHISDISSVVPGKGNATRALQYLVKLADKHKVSLELIAFAYRDDRMSTEDLIRLYQKVGFQLVDDEIDVDAGAEMRYTPQ